MVDIKRHKKKLVEQQAESIAAQMWKGVSVPEYVIDEAADECVERLKRQLLMIINTTSKSGREHREMLNAMHASLKKLKAQLVEDVNAQLEEFFLEQ